MLHRIRIFGCVAFVVYMATTYALYVPDWSFVFHREGDVNDGKRFVVCLTLFPDLLMLSKANESCLHNRCIVFR